MQQSHSKLRAAYYADGAKGFWRENVELLKQNPPQSYFVGAAEVFARAGERDLAFKMLNKAFEAHEHGMAQLKVSPVLNPLRSDPRFVELLRRMNLND